LLAPHALGRQNKRAAAVRVNQRDLQKSPSQRAAGRDMNATEVLRIVDAIHREKNIAQEVIFEAIEAALVSALRKHYGEESDIVVKIDRTTGATTAAHNGEPLSEDVVGRIGAQTAKQVMIQKIREAERDSLFDEYSAEVGQLVTGTVAQQYRVDPAPQRADSWRVAPRRRARAGDDLRSPQGRQPRQDHPQPHPYRSCATDVRAGNP
jgi:hypothetical protein